VHGVPHYARNDATELLVTTEKHRHCERSAAVYPLVAALDISIDASYQSVARKNCVCQHTHDNQSNMPPDIKVFESGTGLLVWLLRS
jgi:hypothetical protein